MSAVRPLVTRGLALAAAVVIIDQVTKWWILERIMLPPRLIEITPFFNLMLTWNRGVSFGLFNTASPWNAWVLSVVALLITALLLAWLARSERRVMAVGLGLIIGGAIGNLIDRVRFGAVADFLDVHAWGWHWPAFNIADAAITIGVAVLIIDSVFGSERQRKHSKLGEETGK